MFHVGQKVSRNERPWPRSKDCVATWPVVPHGGDVLTVRSIFENPHNGKLGLRFFEIRCKIHPCGLEHGFEAECFRPIVERKTDISIFTAMLKPSKVEA